MCMPSLLQWRINGVNWMDKIKQLAHHLKTERLNKGLTQQELSLATGISLRSIQRIESGDVYPRSFTLKALCEKLDIDFYALDLKKTRHESKHKNRICKRNQYLTKNRVKWGYCICFYFTGIRIYFSVPHLSRNCI